MYNKVLTFALFFLFTIVLWGCSEDKERFLSEAPHFSGFTVKNLSDGTESLRVGEPFVITAKQEVRGKLLDRTNYRWEVKNASDWQQKYTKNVIYSKHSENPTDTLVATTPGVFSIIFTADYNPSGAAHSKAITYNLADGGTAELNASALKLRVVLRRTIRVH